MEYANPERNRYAYKLEGVDADWQYTDASKRFAYYNNLKSGTYYAYCVVRNRIRLRNTLHLQEMEKAKIEEVNHAKLQFFTNITHELLTPLTILSASVDEMKQMVPGYKDRYKVMANNINRLILCG